MGRGRKTVGSIARRCIAPPWLLLLSAGFLAGAPAASDDLFDRLENPPRFEHLTSDEGLPHDVVFTLAQDATGYLWMGTEGGPCRYDGGRFTRWGHDPEDPNSLASDDISLIVPEGDAGLWFATWGGGLSYLDLLDETFDHVAPAPGTPGRLQDGRIQALLVEDGGPVWAGTFSTGLARIDRGDGSVTTFRHDPRDPASLPHDRVWAVVRDPQGFLWIGTQKGLARMAPGSTTPARVELAPELPTPQVRALWVDRAGVLWVGTSKGLFRRTGVERFERFEPLGLDLSKDIVNTLYEDRRGALWIGTNGDGLVHCRVMEGGDERCVRHRHRPDDGTSLALDDVRALHEDRSGNLWIATRGGGVDKLAPSPTPFRHLHRDSEPLGLPSRFVWSFAEDPEGQIWVGTGRGLLRTAGEAFETFGLAEPQANSEDRRSSGLADSHVTDLLITDEGTLWVATFEGGLARRASEDDLFEHFRHDPLDPDSLADDHIHKVLQTRDGTVWVGTRRGLDRFDPETAGFRHHRRQLDDPYGLADDQIRDLLETPQGKLWVATEGGWLHLLDPESGRFERLGTDRGLPKGRITALHVRPEDFAPTDGESPGFPLWIGTDKGLVRLASDGGVEVFDPRHGLPGNHVASIESDDLGRLWLGTEQGLVRFDPNSLSLQTFQVRDGLAGRELLDRASFRDSRGRLFLGGLDGLTVLDPAAQVDRPNEAPVVLTGFYRFNQRQRLEPPGRTPERLVLSHQDDFISFTFALLDYDAPRRNRYRYWLEGFDRDWIEAGNRQRADYTNLDPGGYVFHVEATNSRGILSRRPLSFELSIPPPFWQTWWFRLLGLALVVGGVLGIQRQRMAGLRAQERALQRRVDSALEELRKAEEGLHRAKKLESLGLMAGGIAHDFNNLLMVVTGSCEMLRQQVADQAASTPRSDEYLDLIEQATHRASELSLQMLAYVGQGSLRNEVVAARQLLDSLVPTLEQLVGDGQLEVTAAGGSPRLRVDVDQVRQAVVHLVTNAVEASGDSEAAEVEVRLETTERSAADFERAHFDQRPEAGTYLCLTVRDRGIGMDPTMVETIFDPFFTTKFTGRGLGLAFVWGVVRGHRGAIEVDSAPDQGTEIRILLPATHEPPTTDEIEVFKKVPRPSEAAPVAPAPVVAATTAPPQTAVATSQRSGRVLLVDDDATVRRVGQALLEALGFEVVLAAGGREALEVFDRQEEPLRLVVLDLTMPGMGGEATFDALQERDHRPPILLATGYDQHHAALRMRQRDYAGFLQKPYRLDELEAAVDRALAETD